MKGCTSQCYIKSIRWRRFFAKLIYFLRLLELAAAFIDKRTHGFKRRLEAVMQKPDVVVKLIKNALNIGITADYILMEHGLPMNP